MFFKISVVVRFYLSTLFERQNLIQLYIGKQDFNVTMIPHYGQGS